MADLARPALPEVLAALTSTEPDAWSFDRRRVLRLSSTGVASTPPGAAWYTDVVPWAPLDDRKATEAAPRPIGPAEAAELLVTHDVLPAGWCDDTRRGWYCEACDSYGTQRVVLLALYDVDDREVPCERCAGMPPTIPDLVAVASLGWPAIQRAEELARAACLALREYGCPAPQRVVWRVGSSRRYDTVWSRDVRKTETMVLVRDGRFDVPDGFGRIKRHIILPAEALWDSGLALDRITSDAVVVAVPPVGVVQ